MKSSENTLTLKTPRQHGQVAIAPEYHTLLSNMKQNQALLESSSMKVMDHSIAFWRRSCRKELNLLDHNSTWIITGHQAQFFHCGIIIKYLLANQLAKATSTTPINLVVDSDLPKDLTLRFTPKPSTPPLASSIPISNTTIPMECQSVPTASEFQQWIESLKKIGCPENIIESIQKASHQTFSLPELIMKVNHEFANSFGINWIDLPISALSETQAFYAMALDMILRAKEVTEYYNLALKNYRNTHNIHNRLQPLPDLAIENNSTFELPFWIFKKDQARSALFAKTTPEKLVLSNASTTELTFDIDKSISSTTLIDSFRKTLANAGIQLRPRAIALSFFARYFLSDLFIHGIGGGLYDQITDPFASQLYETTPPTFACCSATLYPSATILEDLQETKDQLQHLEYQQRDFRYNPQRYLSDSQQKKLSDIMHQRSTYIEQTKALKAQQAPAKQRKEIFDKIHQINTELFKHCHQNYSDLQNQLTATANSYTLLESYKNRELFFGQFGHEAIKRLKFN